MPKYFLMLTGEGDYASLSPAENQAVYKKFMEWSASLASEGRLVDALRLSHDEYRVLKPGPNPVATDGPFADSKEAVGGYFTIKAADIDEAGRLAAGCPHLQHGGTIHIQGVMEMPAEVECEDASPASA
jgi:hypothetical protein